MKIAHIIWALGIGGAETMLIDIVNAQAETEDVALFVVNDIVNPDLLACICERCKVKLFRRKLGSKNPMPWVCLNMYLYCFKPDVIHFHLEGMRKTVFHPAPKVFTIHNMHTSGKEYSKFNALYSISNAVNRATRAQGYNSKTIWNGIHPEKITPKETINTSGYYRFVCIGRLYSPHKGQDVLIKAMSILINSGVNNVHLDIIGDGDSRSLLESMTIELNINQNVSFLGQKDRNYIYSHLHDYDLFVLPSRSEGFGLTIAEAMCAKIPVLISNLEGPMEVIDNGKLGMHFMCGNQNDLAHQMESFVNNGPNMIQVKMAYDYAIANFDIRHVAERYIDEYRMIIG